MARERLKICANAILDLVFPPRCVVCGKVDYKICPDCWKSIIRVMPPFCPQCGRLVNVPPTALESDCIAACTMCARYPLMLDGKKAAVEFSGVIRKAIHALKYLGRRDLALPLAELMVDAWSENPFPVDILIPVPLHPRRQSQRGYNQSILIAEAFAGFTGIPCLADGLVRWRMTESQTRLSSTDRRANVAGAFVVNKSADLRGLNVLLVDDVSTTGSTLQACAEALRKESVKGVYAMSAARAEWNPISGEMADSYPNMG